VSSDDNDDDLLFMMANLMTMVMTGCLWWLIWQWRWLVVCNISSDNTSGDDWLFAIPYLMTQSLAMSHLITMTTEVASDYTMIKTLVVHNVPSDGGDDSGSLSLTTCSSPVPPLPHPHPPTRRPQHSPTTLSLSSARLIQLTRSHSSQDPF
jgi:hypothetical protein